MILRRVARPMLAAIFISGGINALRAPQAHTQAAKPVLEAVGHAVDHAVELAPVERRPDDEMLVKIDAGVKIVAGTMLAFGSFPRLASTALAASLVPTTLAGHRFWEEDDPEVRGRQQVQFFKNVGLLGGLLLAAADTHGKPSLGWRARKAVASHPGRSSTLGDAAAELSERLAADMSARVGEVAEEVGSRAGEVGGRVVELSQELAEHAARARRKADMRADKLQTVAEKRGAALQKRAAKRADKWQKRAAKRGAAWQKDAARKWEEIEKRAPFVLDQAAKLGHDVAERVAILGAEVAHQADSVATDARKGVAALSH